MKELFRNEIVRKAFLSDILGIPEEEIRTARLLNPFLRKRYKKQNWGFWISCWSSMMIPELILKYSLKPVPAGTDGRFFICQSCSHRI